MVQRVSLVQQFHEAVPHYKVPVLLPQLVLRLPLRVQVLAQVLLVHLLQELEVGAPRRQGILVKHPREHGGTTRENHPEKVKTLSPPSSIDHS